MKLDTNKDDTELTKMKADLDEEKEEKEKAETALADKEADDKKAEEKAEEEKVEADKVEAKNYVDELVEGKKLHSKYQDMEESNYIRFKNEGQKELDLYKEKMESAGKVANFTKMKSPTEGSSDDLTADSIEEMDEAIQMKNSNEFDSKQLGASYDDMDTQVKTLMKRDSISYIEAVNKIDRIANGQEVAL